VQSIKFPLLRTETPPDHQGTVSLVVGRPPMRKWPSSCHTSAPKLACCGDAGRGNDNESTLDDAEWDKEYMCSVDLWTKKEER